MPLLAIVVGLVVATLFEPGSGMALDESADVKVPDNPGFVSVLLKIVPDNIFTAFTELNLLGIIFIAIVFGIALLRLRESEAYAELGEHLYKVVEAFNEITLKVMAGVLQYVPIGVFAIVAKTAGEQGMATIFALGDLVGTAVIARNESKCAVESAVASPESAG